MIVEEKPLAAGGAGEVAPALAVAEVAPERVLDIPACVRTPTSDLGSFSGRLYVLLLFEHAPTRRHVSGQDCAIRTSEDAQYVQSIR